MGALGKFDKSEARPNSTPVLQPPKTRDLKPRGIRSGHRGQDVDGLVVLGGVRDSRHDGLQALASKPRLWRNAAKTSPSIPSSGER